MNVLLRYKNELVKVCNVAVVLAVDAMARLQQAWGSGVTSWTGKDPCAGSW